MRFAMKMMIGLSVVLGFTSAVLAADKVAAPAPAAEKPAAPVVEKVACPGFEKMKALVGDWTGQGVGENHNEKVKVSYALTGAGSALVETMQMGAHGDMVTVYHADGDSVMMTHYCAAGNQPRMRAKGGDKELAFAFVDATNLSSPDAMHMHDLKVSFVDSDHITQEWTMSAGGKKMPATFQLTRQK
jgi:hypothetical protein